MLTEALLSLFITNVTHWLASISLLNVLETLGDVLTLVDLAEQSVS
jgi:hypothetical protein